MLNIPTGSSPKIIIQSDDLKLANEETDVENPNKAKYSNNLIKEENTNESVLRSRRLTTFPNFSGVAQSFKNMYKLNKTNKKSDENEYDIEAGIMLIKKITNEKDTKKYYILLSILIILFFIGFLIYHMAKGFYDETAIE